MSKRTPTTPSRTGPTKHLSTWADRAFTPTSAESTASLPPEFAPGRARSLSDRDAQSQAEIHQGRRAIEGNSGEAQVRHAEAKLAIFIEEALRNLKRRYPEALSLAYGHVGDGNFHTSPLIDMSPLSA